MFAKPGSYPVTITVSAGDEVAFFAGNLVVPDEHADDHAEWAAVPGRLGMVAGGPTILVALLWVGRRLQKRRGAGGSNNAQYLFDGLILGASCSSRVPFLAFGG